MNAYSPRLYMKQIMSNANSCFYFEHYCTFRQGYQNIKINKTISRCSRQYGRQLYVFSIGSFSRVPESHMLKQGGGNKIKDAFNETNCFTSYPALQSQRVVIISPLSFAISQHKCDV